MGSETISLSIDTGQTRNPDINTEYYAEKLSDVKKSQKNKKQNTQLNLFHHSIKLILLLPLFY